ncbi:hypothetical protein L0F63_002647 [Massospora cicadina]|nr:hypothetical protein L0F63_002647 [Massospora cicadina]
MEAKADSSSDSFATYVNQEMVQEASQDVAFDQPNVGPIGDNASPVLRTKSTSDSPGSWSSAQMDNLANRELPSVDWNALYQLGMYDGYAAAQSQAAGYVGLDYFTNPLTASLPALFSGTPVDAGGAMFCPQLINQSFEKPLPLSAPISTTAPLSAAGKKGPTRKPRTSPHPRKKSSEPTAQRASQSAPKSGPSFSTPSFRRRPCAPSAELYIPSMYSDAPYKVESPPETLSAHGEASPENEAARQKMINKRQERLIKNRAAALLSRKRKREQLINLETENERLQSENASLKARVQMLEDMVRELGGMPDPPVNSPSHTVAVQEERNRAGSPERSDSERGMKQKVAGAVFMAMCFSVSFFNLPTTKPGSEVAFYSPAQTLDHVSTRKPSVHVRSPAPFALEDATSLQTHPGSYSERVFSAFVSSNGLDRREVDGRRFYQWVNRSLRVTKPSAQRVAPPADNLTSLVAAGSAGRSAYLYSPTMRAILPTELTNRSDSPAPAVPDPQPHPSPAFRSSPPGRRSPGPTASTSAFYAWMCRFSPPPSSTRPACCDEAVLGTLRHGARFIARIRPTLPSAHPIKTFVFTTPSLKRRAFFQLMPPATLELLNFTLLSSTRVLRAADYLNVLQFPPILPRLPSDGPGLVSSRHLNPRFPNPRPLWYAFGWGELNAPDGRAKLYSALGWANRVNVRGRLRTASEPMHPLLPGVWGAQLGG